VDQPIGKVRYAGVAGGLYMACETVVLCLQVQEGNRHEAG
jgi:hypothetical protein